MKLGKNVRKRLSLSARSAKKSLANGLSASRGMAKRAAQIMVEKAVTKMAVAYLLAAVAAISGLNLGINHLRQNHYKQGCVDGAALALAGLLYSDQFIKDRDADFDKICGELGAAHAQGKTLEDILSQQQ
jgi:hypothetical protein